LTSEDSLTLPLFLTTTSKFDHKFTPSKSLNLINSAIIKKGGTATFIGIPQVGKSTLVNLLLGQKKRLRSTTGVRSYSLTPEVTLLDTPPCPVGAYPLLPLLGLLKPSPETISELLVILDQLEPEYYTQLEKLYGMPALVRPIEGNRFIDPAKDLLVHVARKFRRMGKNGPNLQSAAEIVGDDCLKEKIVWWVPPPEE
jgi:ribosome biogenesis GTPase A